MRLLVANSQQIDVVSPITAPSVLRSNPAPGTLVPLPLGLVASLVLRCDDCVKYHLVEARKAGNDRKAIVEAMSIGLVVGGTIVIPHLRRAVEFLDDLESEA